MKNECAVVRDLIPLYLENMVSGDTAAFVREHLEHCEECRQAAAALSEDAPVFPKNAPDTMQNEEVQALHHMKKKLRQKMLRMMAGTALCLLALLTLLHYFPVYHVLEACQQKVFQTSQISYLLYIGDRDDRALAETVLQEAGDAFSDVSHTREENEAAYGALSLYALEKEVGAVDEKHSIELLSAHFDGAAGHIWVRYSSEALDAKGDVVCRRNTMSYWYLEQDLEGNWLVRGIQEAP